MKKIEKPNEVIYVSKNFKTNKYELTGMYSENNYGSFDSKQEAHEQFLVIMDVAKVNVKKKS